MGKRERIGRTVLAIIAWMFVALISMEPRAQLSDEGARTLVAARQHNALLARLDKLEPLYLSDRDNKKTLRDLVTTYVALLGFDQGTDFGSNLFLLASMRLDALTTISGTADALLIARLRALLFFHLKAFPMAVEALVGTDSAPDMIILRHLLREIGQDRFREIKGFRRGEIAVRVFESLAEQPDAPGFLWPVEHYIVTTQGNTLPHRVSSFSLVRQGTPSTGRYYLYFNNLNRSGMTALYGTRRPPRHVVRNEVMRTLQTFMAPKSQ